MQVLSYVYYFNIIVVIIVLIFEKFWRMGEAEEVYNQEKYDLIFKREILRITYLKLGIKKSKTILDDNKEVFSF